MPFKKAFELELTPTAPFDFDATFHKPDHFTSGDNACQPGVRWQTWRWQGEALGLKFENRGEREAPRLQVSGWAAGRLAEGFIQSLVVEVSYRYNLNLDLSGFYRAFETDPLLGPVLQRWRGMRPGHPSSLYEYLMIGIVLQNATVRRSMQMFSALLEGYGSCLAYDGQQLWCFWAPGGLQEVSEDELRGLKVGYRAKSIKRIDEAFAQGAVDELDLRRLDREAQRQALLKLYGVGPATVWYLLFDVFHQWDFFNHISPWEQKIYSKLFFDVDPETPVPVADLLAIFERFGAYKQLAVHYIWEDLWWQRKQGQVPWLDKLVRA
jgi:3-methyladenine DNA glycosylase/8-oxoguanine DNA glycosylase